MNTAHTCFAFGSGTSEKVAGQIFEVLKFNIRLEECVDRRLPMCLEYL
jgi:hypothetical protein